MSYDATLVTRMKLEAELANVQTACAYLQLERDNIAVQRDTALAELSVIRAVRDALRAALRQCRKLAQPYAGDHNNSLGAYEACDKIERAAAAFLASAPGEKP